MASQAQGFTQGKNLNAHVLDYYLDTMYGSFNILKGSEIRTKDITPKMSDSPDDTTVAALGEYAASKVDDLYRSLLDTPQAFVDFLDEMSERHTLAHSALAKHLKDRAMT